LVEHFHGKEGVNGSSPLEGFNPCPRLKSRGLRTESNLSRGSNVRDPAAEVESGDGPVSAGVRCRIRSGELPGISKARFSKDEPARCIEHCRPT